MSHARLANDDDFHAVSFHLYPEYLHDLVPEVVDDLHGDAPGGGSVERPRDRL